MTDTAQPDTSEQTTLDLAYLAMEPQPDAEAPRLAFHDKLSATELFLMLAEEADGDPISPEVFEVEGGSVVLAFDRVERLAEFAGRIVPYAAMSGATLAGLLAGQGLGLGLNLGVAPASTLLPSDAMDWLADMLAEAPAEVQARPESFFAPKGLPDALLTSLDARLAASAGLADAAYLTGVRYDDGAQGHLMAFLGAVPGAEDALARSVSSALSFSGIEAGAIDVVFLSADDPLQAALSKAGLRFDLPAPEAAPTAVPGSAPGMEPNRPPKLR